MLQITAPPTVISEWKSSPRNWISPLMKMKKEFWIFHQDENLYSAAAVLLSKKTAWAGIKVKKLPEGFKYLWIFSMGVGMCLISKGECCLDDTDFWIDNWNNTWYFHTL